MAVILVRTLRVGPPPQTDPLAVSLSDGVSDSGERLAALIRVPTVSIEGLETDSLAFAELHEQMASLWPTVHARLSLERIGHHSLLYRWEGRDPQRSPVILMAHQDVVPADTSDSWTAPPFSGLRADGFIWGRGALDDKGSLVAILDAVTGLLETGFQPSRTVYLAFGHDEEIGGVAGAGEIAAVLRARGIRPAFVLDEGGFATYGAIPGVDRPVAVVGIAEKGSASFRLTAYGDGGHSSVPPKEMAITMLAEGLSRLHAAPFPARLDGATAALFQSVTHAMPVHLRALFANRWLTDPLLLRVLASRPTTNATIRTSTAFTMLSAGTKPNVLPDRAQAVVNFRLLPGDSVEDVAAHIARVLDGSGMDIERLSGSEAVGPAPTDNSAFRFLARAIRSTHPDSGLIVAPYMATGGTDAKHFAGLTDHLYRYIPFDLHTARDGILLHGVDERVAEDQMIQAVRFYATLLTGLDQFDAE
ncbi:MAG: M20/M25/M40 family metallo-hydrolase [Rhodothermales bacterium]|nr:M20/M25/M40 family metallo-hydrolase [Rhodothermales bacterium]